ncbi:MAG TPA: catalase family protein [Myxococcaceae bacterium]|nr:catalase family protein [Myxococcaceae bacterium]
MSPPTWQERIPEGEAARLEVLASQLNAIQKRRAQKNGGVTRALHAKGLGVTAELTVLPDIDPRARAGIFAAPGTFRAYLRYSNGSGLRQHDKVGDVRGLAIKLLGVPGKKIIPALENAPTQDFLLVQSPTTPFRNAEEFMAFVRAAESPATLLPKVLFHFGPLSGLRLIRKLVAGVSRPVPSVATARYYSAAPIRWGDQAVHLALTPHAASPAEARTPEGHDGIGEEMTARLAAGPVTYDFQLQFFKDEASTPIEDASVEWKEADAPFVTVARLTIPKQDMRSPRGQKIAAFVETLSFDPWHAPVEFRPLGNIMRARNAAYRMSTHERKAVPEPDGSERFD